MAELAEQSGIPEATLYSIEGHMVSPPLGNLVSLARVFEISMGDFFSDNGDAPSCIVRKDDRKTVSRFNSTDGKGGGYSYESLGHHKKNRHMEPFLVTLTPTESSQVEPQISISARRFFLSWKVRLKSSCSIRQRSSTPEIQSITIRPCRISSPVMAKSRQRCWPLFMLKRRW